MAEIVNLNQYRKGRARKAAEKAAAENRIRHGQSTAERRRGRREREKVTKDLDDKRLD